MAKKTVVKKQKKNEVELNPVEKALNPKVLKAITALHRAAQGTDDYVAILYGSRRVGGGWHTWLPETFDRELLSDTFIGLFELSERRALMGADKEEEAA
jgi:hypothetical protein